MSQCGGDDLLFFFFFFSGYNFFFFGGVLNEGSVDKWSGKHVGSFRVW